MFSRLAEYSFRLRRGIALVGVLLAASMPTSAEAHMGHDERIAALTRKIRGRPRDPDLYILRAEAYRRLGRHDRALRDLAVVERLDARHRELPCERALTLAEAGLESERDTRLFERDASRCLELDHSRTDVHVVRARFEEARGEIEAALGDWHAAWELRAAPDLAVGYALTLERAGRVDDALGVIRDAVVRLEGATSVHRVGFELGFRHGRFADALAHADALVGAAPRVADFHLLRARVSFAAGAAADAERSLSAAYSNATARGVRTSALHLATLVRVCFATSDDDAAHAAFAQLERLEGSDAADLVGDLSHLVPLRQLSRAPGRHIDTPR